MKLIFASKFYYRRAGLESYLLKCEELLKNNGHEVVPFSTNYAENIPTPYSKYFCNYYELSHVNKLNIVHNIKAVKNMFFNREAYNLVKDLCLAESPHLFQGFGVTKHLSSSIFKAAKQSGTKTIMRLSDYALMCPNSAALDNNETICNEFECITKNNLKCISLKCVKDSRLASIVGYLEVKGNNILNNYRKYVDHWIAPSNFIKNIFIKYYNIPESKITYLPVFFDSSKIIPSYEDDGYILYAGRISREKGLLTLLKSLKNTSLSIKIVGSGPLEKEVKDFASGLKNNIEFLGHINFNELQKLIMRARLVVVPSEWYENSPNVILEAYAWGKPVIGADIGGIPEMIIHNQTGLLFESGNSGDLKAKIISLFEDTSKINEMGKNARQLVENELNANKHYEKLMDIYKSVIDQ